ncbi:unnamed protein product [Notodromas monacha]|uniref:Uncharacterized protein n=1 Tax=Notodromas monacha TaxID=399045 RepID=A0A7R9GIP8_9CRUS|nr:unnamed protein product [Notodromas monacha]CAG0922683.1 unnamed protein product [Notodromas monacha]
MTAASHKGCGKFQVRQVQERQADSLLELKGSGVKMRHRNKVSVSESPGATDSIRTTTDSGYQTTGPGNEQSSRSSDSPIYDLITENGSSPEPDFTFDSTGSVLSDEILEACKLPFLRSPERKGHNYKETSRVNEGATAMASPFIGNNLMRRRYDQQESSDENEDHKSESISASATLEMEEQLKGMTQLLEMKGVINAKKSTQDKIFLLLLEALPALFLLSLYLIPRPHYNPDKSLG